MAAAANDSCALPEGGSGRPRCSWRIPAILAALAVLAYSNTLRAPFIYDDINLIVRNPDVRTLRMLPLHTRSLVALTFKLNYAAGGLNAIGYHATNLLIHVLAGLLLYGIARRTLMLPVLNGRYGPVSTRIAAVAAAIWLIHPLQTESVTYVCQRYESMMGLFLLLALYCFARACVSGRPRVWHGLCLAAAVLGMATKEVIVVLPPLILLYDCVFVAPSPRGMPRARAMFHVALFLCWGVFLMLWLQLRSASMASGIALVPGVSRWTYLAAQLGVMTRYLRLALFPWPLSIDNALQLPAHWTVVLIPGAFIVALVLSSCAALLRRRPMGFVGVSFFLLLAPTSSILPLSDLAAEHRMYLALAPVSVFMALLFHHAADVFARNADHAARLRRVLFPAIAVPVVLACGSLAFMRNSDYASPERLWRREIRLHPANPRAYNELAMHLIQAGKFRDAMSAAAAAVWIQTRRCAPPAELAPRDVAALEYQAGDPRPYALGHTYIGICRHHMGRLEDAGFHYRRALAVEPAYPGNPVFHDARYNLALVLAATNRRDESLRELKALLARFPGDFAANNAAGDLLAQQLDYEGAIRRYEEALRGDPSNAKVRAKLDLVRELAARARQPE